MLQRTVYRTIARGWLQSAHWYGGRSRLLAGVLLSNLTAVTLFGGGIMLLLVAVIETAYSFAAPDSPTWFSPEAGRALAGYGAIAFFASFVPMGVTAAINRMYRRRCKTCKR